jgi:hypothetical protein
MKKFMLLILFLIASGTLFAEDPMVSIYDGLFGKSVHRGVIVSIKKSAFVRSETLDVDNDDEMGYLTAVVMLEKTAKKLINGSFGLKEKKVDGFTIYYINKEGLDFSFSIEKANDKIINMVSNFYSDDEIWHDELVDYYKKNYVIRIHSAENIFDSWTEEITYNEAIVAATLLGDEDQWLWGIHNGSDILNSGY